MKFLEENGLLDKEGKLAVNFPLRGKVKGCFRSFYFWQRMNPSVRKQRVVLQNAVPNFIAKTLKNVNQHI